MSRFTTVTNGEIEMTNEENEAFRELVYVAKEICHCMAVNPT